MKFYVNQIQDRILTNGIPYGKMVIGLFTQCETKGEGSFCGYYGQEYYLNTVLHAYYIAEGSIYSPEKRISDVTICYPPVRFNKTPIGSHMWTMVIEANTLEEAIEAFKKAKWRRWMHPVDEFGMPPIHTCPKCDRYPLVSYRGSPNINGMICKVYCPGDKDVYVETTGKLLEGIDLWNDMAANYSDGSEEE